MAKKKGPAQTIPTPAPQTVIIETAEQAIVALWDGLMRQWREGCPSATVMLHHAPTEAVEAYRKVYGPTVVPLFAAMTKRVGRGAA